MIMKVLACALLAVVLSVLYVALSIVDPDTARSLAWAFAAALLLNFIMHNRLKKVHRDR